MCKLVEIAPATRRVAAAGGTGSAGRFAVWPNRARSGQWNTPTASQRTARQVSDSGTGAQMECGRRAYLCIGVVNDQGEFGNVSPTLEPRLRIEIDTNFIGLAGLIIRNPMTIHLNVDHSGRVRQKYIRVNTDVEF